MTNATILLLAGVEVMSRDISLSRADNPCLIPEVGIN
jgi:hypothetical protein